MFITISCDNRIFWDEYAKIEYNLRGEIISEVTIKFSRDFYTLVIWLFHHYQPVLRIWQRNPKEGLCRGTGRAEPTGKFDAYVLWPLAKKFQNWIVDRSTARDFTVYGTSKFEILQIIRKKLQVVFGFSKQCLAAFLRCLQDFKFICWG